MRTGDEIDACILGCPHASIREIAEFANLLKGRKVAQGVRLWVDTARGTKGNADAMGYTKIIEEAGGRIITESCPTNIRIPAKTHRHTRVQTGPLRARHAGMRSHHRQDRGLCADRRWRESGWAMREKIEIKGRSVVRGRAAGEALVADATLSFWGEVDAVTGRIIAVGHPLEGESLRDRVLIIRSTKGSSGTPMILKLAKLEGNAPVALVNVEVDGLAAARLHR